MFFVFLFMIFVFGCMNGFELCVVVLLVGIFVLCMLGLFMIMLVFVVFVKMLFDGNNI